MDRTSKPEPIRRLTIPKLLADHAVKRRPEPKRAARAPQEGPALTPHTAKDGRQRERAGMGGLRAASAGGLAVGLVGILDVPAGRRCDKA
jgi:hypothetical protein